MATLVNTSKKKSMIGLDKVVSIDLATFSEPARGSLTVVGSKGDIPFPIARVFYLYGMGNNCERGAHAHREAQQVFIAVAGYFSLQVTNTSESRTYAMNQPSRAVYVPPLIWARVHDFSKDAVCLVLTSTPYDPADYIRDWDTYVSEVGKLSR